MVDVVPPKLVLPATVSTVNVTEPVRFAIPDVLTVHGVALQLPEPVAPLLHVQVTAAVLFVVTVTLAVQVDPLFVLELLSVTVVPDVEPVGVADAWLELPDSLVEVSTARTT